MDATTSIEKAKQPEGFEDAQGLEKAQKEKKAPLFIEDLDDCAEMKRNARISLVGEVEGGVGMKRPQKYGAFFRILVSNVVSDTMPGVVIFNHDKMREKLSMHPSGQLLLCDFRASLHRGIPGVVSADDSAAHCNTDEQHFNKLHELQHILEKGGELSEVSRAMKELPNEEKKNAEGSDEEIFHDEEETEA